LDIAVIHVGSTEDFKALSPIRRCLTSLFLLTIKDRATSFCQTREFDQTHLKYEVDGQWQELVPLPDELAILVGPETRKWINPSPTRRAIADRFRRLANHFDPLFPPTSQYPFLMIVDCLWAYWEVTIQGGNHRSRVTFELLECSDWCRERVNEVLKDKIAPADCGRLTPL
jgi:hypothetical protein